MLASDATSWCRSLRYCETIAATLVATSRPRTSAWSSRTWPTRLLASHATKTTSRTAAPPPEIRKLWRSEEHTSELQSLAYLVCRLLLEKKNANRQELKVSR